MTGLRSAPIDARAILCYTLPVKKSPIGGYAEVFKALGDEKRLRVLLLLRERSLCVCELSEALDTPFSTLSAHLKILKTARLVENAKDGRWVVYRLVEESPVVRTVLDALERELGDDETLRRDRANIAGTTREACAVKLRVKQKKRPAAPALGASARRLRKAAKPRERVLSAE